MKRKKLHELITWKNSPSRKPLMLKGARQVGKTYLLEQFGREQFSRFHRINFEKQSDVCPIFDANLDPHRILADLSLYLGTDIDTKRDLLIFDEIQACPKAITSLKYFCEDLPELALCSAGSLLGIHLANTSYPVGKVDLMKLHPMNFEEFLVAIGDERYEAYLNEVTLNSQIQEPFHRHLWNQLLFYFVVGGLPEVVQTYRDHRESPVDALTRVRKKQQELITNYYADMAKHAGKINAMHIERVWSSLPTQLARDQDGSSSKFRFKGIVPQVNRYQQLVGVIDWLEAAGLVLKISIAESAQLPLLAYTKENSFKLMLFDVGILGALSDLPPQAILSHCYGSYKGYFAENFVSQELAASGAEHLYSWHEGRAEVEFLQVIDGSIIPIEVKSGWVTHAKSLKSFTDKYHPPYKIILSAKNLQVVAQRNTHFYPLYLAGRLPLSG